MVLARTIGIAVAVGGILVAVLAAILGFLVAPIIIDNQIEKVMHCCCFI